MPEDFEKDWQVYGDFNGWCGEVSLHKDVKELLLVDEDGNEMVFERRE